MTQYIYIVNVILFLCMPWWHAWEWRYSSTPQQCMEVSGGIAPHLNSAWRWAEGLLHISTVQGSEWRDCSTPQQCMEVSAGTAPHLKSVWRWVVSCTLGKGPRYRGSVGPTGGVQASGQSLLDQPLINPWFLSSPVCSHVTGLPTLFQLPCNRGVLPVRYTIYQAERPFIRSALCWVCTVFHGWKLSPRSAVPLYDCGGR